MTKQDFYNQAQAFLKHLFRELSDHKIVLKNHWTVDHLCYRTETLDSYLKLREQFKSWGTLLIESDVNGRPIATFKLAEPVEFEGRVIDLVELPAPKAGKKTVEGFEHVEVVSDLSMSEIKKAFAGRNFDEGGLKKNFNPELEIILNGCAIKFHPLSLESVINVEKNEKVHAAMKNSKVLEILKPYHPQVVGTYPLDISVEASDVDIVVDSTGTDTIADVLSSHFHNLTDFAIKQTHVKGVKTVIANFKFDDVPFEIFAQPLESVKQAAYIHFQVEEKLLKLGGNALKSKIQKLRKQGLKTEPAFAAALGISEDPYEALLKLQILSEAEMQLIMRESLV